MASKAAWSRVGSMLEITYGKMLTEDKKRALYQRLDRLTDEVIEEAVGRHLDTPEAGRWPPTPADVFTHVEQIEQEAQAERSKRLEVAKYALESASAHPEGGKILRVPEALRAQLNGREEVIVSEARCRHCIDSGFVNYYLPKDQSAPHKKYEVYTAAEFSELPEDMQFTLKRYTAICRCAAGDYKKERYQTLLKGIEDQGRIRRGMVLIAEVEAMSRKRQEREAEYIGAAADG
jgi:hypothetical protein